MAVKIRLARRGRKKMAIYDVVVADARAPRDGRYIEKIGRYNPNVNPAQIDLDEDKAFDWVMKGAQPTDTVKAMLSYRGVMLKKHLQIGVNKGAISQEDADKKFNTWKEEKDNKIAGKKDQLDQESASEAKTRKEAEAKVKEARAEALQKRNADAIAAAEAANAPAVEEAPEASTEVAEEAAPVAETTEAAPVTKAEAAPKEEAPKEEAPKVEAAKEEAPAEEDKKED